MEKWTEGTVTMSILEGLGGTFKRQSSPAGHPTLTGTNAASLWATFGSEGAQLFYKALKPNGKLVIVEYYKNETAMPNGRALTHIRLNKPDVIKEVEANQFRLVSESEHIENVQYMLVLEKKQGAG